MRVLLIRFSSLGDCVLLCPLAAHLKRAGAREVVVLTKRAYADVFAAAEGVDRVIAIGKGVRLHHLARIAREFDSPDDVVIDAHANLRSAVAARSAGGARARFRKYTRERLGLIVFKRPAALPTMLERYAALAAGAGFDPAVLSPGGVVLHHAHVARAERAIGRGEAVAVAPGSRWRAKRWGGFADLCESLADARIVLVGSEGDRAVTNPIAARLGNRCVDLAGRVSLMEAAAYISCCAAFVGNDSGLAHLAEAVGVPVVALFGPTVREFGYAPALPTSTIVERRLACRPCSRNGATPCPKRTYECLAGIQPAEVQRVVRAVLAGRRGRAVLG
jgi:heptosyltransferase-2